MEKSKNASDTFRLLVRDATAAIIVLTGPEMRVEIVNAAYGRLIDFHPDDLVGKPLFDMIPDAHDAYYPILDKVRRTGEMLQLYDTPYSVTSNGKKIEGYLHAVYQPYRDVKNVIVGVMVIMQDVTEAVLARKRLEESEKKFQAAVVAVEGILWTNNAAGEMIGEQPGWAALTGQTFDQYQGFGWADAVHPDDAQPTIEAWNEAVANKSTFHFEHRLRTKDALWKLFSIKAVPLFDEFGSITQWVGVHTDITPQRDAENKLKESEQELRQITEALPQMVWVCNEKGETTYFNRQWYEYTGAREEIIMGNRWIDLVHPDDSQRVLQIWATAQETLKPVSIEYRLRSEQGEYHWVLSDGVPIVDSEGKLQKWFGACTFIDEQKKFAKLLEDKVEARTIQLEEKNLELQRLNEELAAFNYVSSHDLQEPLRKIQTFADRILDTEKETLSDVAKGYFNRMLLAAERMQTLIKDLLAFSHLTGSESVFELADLNKITKEVIDDFQEVINEKGVSVKIIGQAEARVVAFQFKQMMQNLFGNALKFMRNDVTATITLRFDSVPATESPFKNRKAVYISIEDNGIGFEKEFSEKIFQMFQRLHSKDVYAGTGIGLSIVKKIVDNHNGIISADSNVGLGTVFHIYLPV